MPHEFWEVLRFSIISLAVLFVLTKLIGNRQMSQLTMFDYIIGISMGSIAAEMASRPGDENWYGILAMCVYAAFAILIGVLNDKSRKLRKIILGEPLVLFDNGVLYYNNLKSARLDLTEFMTECRGAGYFDLSGLQLVLMEVNGKLSFLPNEQNRPLTPLDMDMDPKQTRPAIAVIMDGSILTDRLKTTGNNETWLTKQMKAQGFDDPKDIFLASVDNNNVLTLYEKNEDAQRESHYS